MKVTVVEMGKSQVTINVPDDCTVGKLAELAEINPTLELRIKGEAVAADTPLSEGAVVVATEDVKGGIR